MTVEVLAANLAGGPSSAPFTTGGSDSQVFLRADVAGLSGNGKPTGTVNFTDNGAPLPGNPYALNSEGNTITPNGVCRFAPGQHSIAASYGGDPSFKPTGTTAPASFTITQAVGSDFSLSSQPTITILHPGSEGIATLKIAGIGAYKGTVDFSPASCSGLPSETICTFSPASVKGSGRTTLTIITTGASNNAAGIESPPNRVGPLSTRGGIALCCMLISFVLLGVRSRLRCPNTALGLAVIGCLLVAAGCGGSGWSPWRSRLARAIERRRRSLRHSHCRLLRIKSPVREIE